MKENKYLDVFKDYYRDQKEDLIHRKHSDSLKTDKQKMHDDVHTFFYTSKFEEAKEDFYRYICKIKIYLNIAIKFIEKKDEFNSLASDRGLTRAKYLLKNSNQFIKLLFLREQIIECVKNIEYNISDPEGLIELLDDFYNYSDLVDCCDRICFDILKIDRDTKSFIFKDY